MTKTAILHWKKNTLLCRIFGGIQGPWSPALDDDAMIVFLQSVA